MSSVIGPENPPNSEVPSFEPKGVDTKVLLERVSKLAKKALSMQAPVRAPVPVPVLSQPKVDTLNLEEKKKGPQVEVAATAKKVNALSFGAPSVHPIGLIGVSSKELPGGDLPTKRVD